MRWLGRQTVAMLPEHRDVLDGLVGSIFGAGLALHQGLAGPSAALHQAVEDALGMLDETIAEARSAAFTSYGHRTSSPGTAEPATGPRAGTQAPRPVTPVSADVVRQSKSIAAAARGTRAQSRLVKLGTVEAAGLAASAEESVARTFSDLASTRPAQSAVLCDLSELASSHAVRLRRWAQQLGAKLGGDHTGSRQPIGPAACQP